VNAAAITITAMVTVNTVVLVLGRFGLDERSAAIGLAAFGAGGVAAALFLPRLVTGRNERAVMLRAAAVMAALLLTGAVLPGYGSMLALWAALGATSTLAQLPMTTLLRRKSAPGERQGIYAAHYALTHLLLLFAYLAAGWVGAELGMAAAFLCLALIAGLATATAALAWPAAAGRPPRAGADGPGQ
jgi:predicted MFS family arabinose efflux permease